MKFIELCQYTLKRSLEDNGVYKDRRTAQELIDESK